MLGNIGTLFTILELNIFSLTFSYYMLSLFYCSIYNIYLYEIIVSFTASANSSSLAFWHSILSILLEIYSNDFLYSYSILFFLLILFNYEWNCSNRLILKYFL